MTQIIIGPTGITGLSLSPGLTLGTGLILGFGGFTGIIFQGAGGLIPTSDETIQEAARFSGAGSLSYSGSLAVQVSAVFAGAGSLSSNIGDLFSATFGGTGSLSASTLETIQEGATFLGAGGLSASTLETIQEGAVFSGSGSLSYLGSLALQGLAVFSGSGSLSYAGSLGLAATANLPGTGSLTANIIKAISATFSGAGSLTANIAKFINAEFDAAGSLSATVTAALQGVATFNGAGSLAASLFVGKTDSAAFAGAGSLTAPFQNYSLVFVPSSLAPQSLSRTGNASANQQKFTVAFWVNKTNDNTYQTVYSAGDGTALNRFEIYVNESGNQFEVIGVTGGTIVADMVPQTDLTSGVSHHVCVGVDTTQATPANRVKIYFDGVQITAWDNDTQPAQSTNLSNNFANTYYIGRSAWNSLLQLLNGHLSEYYYIDGQQLTPASFTQTVGGVLVPQPYSGSFTGVFDFYLPFTQKNSLGADFSGEGNTWTANNGPTQSASYP